MRVPKRKLSINCHSKGRKKKQQQQGRLISVNLLEQIAIGMIVRAGRKCCKDERKEYSRLRHA